jgi:CRISPR-associated protein Cas2
MSLTVVVTRDVEARYRGYLASIMLEVSPGTYVSPRLSRGVRDELWQTLEDWHRALLRGCIVMIWHDRASSGGIGMRMLGTPPRIFIDVDNILLTKRDT